MILKVGEILIAEAFCGFPDSTTQGKEYIVSKVDRNRYGNVEFKIIDDNGIERFPISTRFKKKVS